MFKNCDFGLILNRGYFENGNFIVGLRFVELFLLSYKLFYVELLLLL